MKQRRAQTQSAWCMAAALSPQNCHQSWCWAHQRPAAQPLLRLPLPGPAACKWLQAQRACQVRAADDRCAASRLHGSIQLTSLHSPPLLLSLDTLQALMNRQRPHQAKVWRRLCRLNQQHLGTDKQQSHLQSGLLASLVRV